MKERKYIMHLDGDAFFVSVEAAKNPSLRGKPVVTGQERGIASALSYEAKKLGITRAMPIFQIRKLFPQVIVVNSDYESYAIFSKRMMDIVRRYTDEVEEYSIDECFADFTHIAGFHKDSRGTLSRIKEDIRRELGITVSLGLGPSKVIAKTASKRNKPDGLTILEPWEVPEALSKTPIDSVWGIGSATAFALRKKGVSTALDLATRPLSWVRENFSKPLEEMWYELNSISVLEVRAGSEAQKSIMKTRTFVPASKDKECVFSELSKNIENACKKARETGLIAREFSVYLKTRDFTYRKDWSRLASPSHDSFEIIKEARRIFDRIFEAGCLYRATGVTLYGLLPVSARQDDLFGEREAKSASERIFETVDRLNKKYGKPLIRVASSSRAFDREGKGDAPTFMPKGVEKRLAIPYLGEAK